MENPLTPTDRGMVEFSRHKRTLEERLESIQLEPGKAEAEAKKAGEKLVRDKLAGMFRITDLINTMLKWNEETDKAIKGAKRDKLFVTYLEMSDKNEAAISQLKEFLTNPVGNTLFNKIIRIVDDNPPDIELLHYLSNTLSCVINSGFEKLFTEHKHALSQIERLTPQALGILADSANFPEFYSSAIDHYAKREHGDRTPMEDAWISDFSKNYIAHKGLDGSIVSRVSSAVRELHNAGYIRAWSKRAPGREYIGEGPAGPEYTIVLGTSCCDPTEHGKMLLKYINEQG